MPRRIDTQAVINAVRLDEQAGDPAQPAAGFWLVYAKAGGLYIQDDAGNVTGPFTTGGDVATDTIWDAAGDLVQATGANAASKLSIGTYPQLLRVNSGATAAEWVSAGRVLIGQQTPTGTNVSFTGIPATYNSLEIEYIARSDRAGSTSEGLLIYLNNDTTATNYRKTLVYGQAASSVAASGTDTAEFGNIPGASSVAGSCGQGWGKIINYASTTFRKQITKIGGYRLEDTTNYERAELYSIEWENTAAVNRVDIITANATNFIAGTTFRLYGVF